MYSDNVTDLVSIIKCEAICEQIQWERRFESCRVSIKYNEIIKTFFEQTRFVKLPSNCLSVDLTEADELYMAGSTCEKSCGFNHAIKLLSTI